MKVLLFGASGMVGAGALLECLDDDRIESVVVVGRSRCGVEHPKLREILHTDFFDYSALDLAGFDTCFFTIGVSAAGLSEAEYARLNHDLPLAAAAAFLAASPGATFCYVSGQGTKITSRMMWARVKGRTEAALLAMPFRGATMFRPGFIQPLRGVRSKTKLYQTFYDLLGPLIPIFRRLAPGAVTTTVAVGRAMIRAAVAGCAEPILETRDINRVAAGG